MPTLLDSVSCDYKVTWASPFRGWQVGRRKVKIWCSVKACREEVTTSDIKLVTVENLSTLLFPLEIH